MTREEKSKELLNLCVMNGPCSGCPAKDITEPDVECDFDSFDEELLDKYLEAFGETCEVPAACETVQHNADNIHPQHCKLPGGMEVIDVEVALFGKEAVMHHCFCTAAEYILRHMQKNGAEDVRKAHWWLEKYLELEESK